ncbi:MAG TPA: hypothetical protein VGD40_24990 [Chryseosolibacter sp.]
MFWYKRVGDLASSIYDHAPGAAKNADFGTKYMFEHTANIVWIYVW